MLKVVLVVVGLLFIAGVIPLLMYWIVTLTSVALLGWAMLVFVRSGFSHPMRVGTCLGVLSTIWDVYFAV